MKIVFFAGGVGSRLWPLSRKKTPKQFEKIIGDKSSLQLAVERVLPICSPSDIYISTGVHYKETVLQQLPEIPRDNFILEPEMRDVGAAVGLVAGILDKVSPNEPFIILWSDHLVKNEELFQKVLLAVEGMLKKDPDKIIFLGQSSRFASENLGWIEQGSQVDEVKGLPVFSFKSFHYRPQKMIAEKFHTSKNHFWNPGYFGTTPSFLFSMYKKFTPEMYDKLVTIRDAWGTKSFDRINSEIYPTLEKLHFDNIVPENIDERDGYVIAADLGWSDIGAWEALKEALCDSEEENVTKGQVMIQDSRDSLVFNYTDQVVVGIDLDKMLVVNIGDVLLVCPKTSVPKIKKFVESLAGTEHERLT